MTCGRVDGRVFCNAKEYVVNSEKMEEALRSVPLRAKASAHYILKAQSQRDAVYGEREGVLKELEYYRCRVRELEKKLAESNNRLQESAIKLLRIRQDAAKSTGLSIAVVGSAAVPMDMCIDFASAGPVLDLVSGYELKCRNCKSVTATQRVCTVCSACGSPALPQNAILFVERGVLQYK